MWRMFRPTLFYVPLLLTTMFLHQKNKFNVIMLFQNGYTLFYGVLVTE